MLSRQVEELKNPVYYQFITNVSQSGEFTEEMIPTVGFNTRKVTKGRVVLKFWDVGGQPRFRTMWERYCREVDAILFVVDAADHAKLESAKRELHDLVSRPTLRGIPLLVLGNKNDLSGALSAEELVDKMDLSLFSEREVACYSVSAKNQVNIGLLLQWLTAHGRSKRPRN